jgi:hypothetical protein
MRAFRALAPIASVPLLRPSNPCARWHGGRSAVSLSGIRREALNSRHGCELGTAEKRRRQYPLPSSHSSVPFNPFSERGIPRELGRIVEPARNPADEPHRAIASLPNQTGDGPISLLGDLVLFFRLSLECSFLRIG